MSELFLHNLNQKLSGQNQSPKVIMSEILASDVTNQKEFESFLISLLNNEYSAYVGLKNYAPSLLDIWVRESTPGMCSKELVEAVINAKVKVDMNQEFWNILVQEAKNHKIENLQDIFTKNLSLRGILALDEPLAKSNLIKILNKSVKLNQEDLFKVCLNNSELFDKDLFRSVINPNVFTLSKKEVFFFRNVLAEEDFLVEFKDILINQWKNVSDNIGYDALISSERYLELFKFIKDSDLVKDVLGMDSIISMEGVFSRLPKELKDDESLIPLLIARRTEAMEAGAFNKFVLSDLSFSQQCNPELLKLLNPEMEIPNDLVEVAYLALVKDDFFNFISLPKEWKENADFVSKVEKSLENHKDENNIHFWLMLPDELKFDKTRLQKYFVQSNQEDVFDLVTQHGLDLFHVFNHKELYENDEKFFFVLDYLSDKLNGYSKDIDSYLDCFKNETFSQIIRDANMKGAIENLNDFTQVSKYAQTKYQEMLMVQELGENKNVQVNPLSKVKKF